MTIENLELSVTGLIDAPVGIVWKIATQRLEEWWCPKPWTRESYDQHKAMGFGNGWGAVAAPLAALAEAEARSL